MFNSLSKFGLRLSLAIPLYFSSLAAAEAAPYASTYLGDLRDLRISSTIYNERTGLSYDFETTTRPLTVAETENLPQVTLQQGSGDSNPVTYTMQATAINDAGTVIGSMPAGARLSNPWSVLSMVYTTRSSDGSYSPAVELSPAANAGSEGWLALSQANQILIQDSQGARLFDVNRGTTTPLDDLIPQELFTRYRGFRADGIDDRGQIIISGLPLQGGDVPIWETSAFLLTPPSVPEPSTLWLFGAAAGVIGVRTAVRRRRAAAD